MPLSITPLPAPALTRYPAPFLSGLLHLLGSHDTSRIRTQVGPERARLAAVLLLTAPGVPIIYYGDEIGMEGGPDPDCRRCMEWDPGNWDHGTLELHRRWELPPFGALVLAAEPV